MVAPAFEVQLQNQKLAAWHRLWVWCMANANANGHARAYPGELRDFLRTDDSREVSRAIRLAREHGVIDNCSNAGCLVLPGHSGTYCPAIHRGDV